MVEPNHPALSVRRQCALLGLSLKYEVVDLRGYATQPELERGLRAYFAFDNGERLHQSLGYKIPAEVYRAGRTAGPPVE